MVILWRIGVVIALAAAALRVGGLGFLLPGAVWYALQFGPLLALGVVEAIRWFRSRSQRTQSRPRSWVVASASLLVLVAAASSLWADDPLQTISQAGLLAVVFLFLVPTYAHRWTSSDALRGDLQTVLWTGIVLQAVGVTAYLAGQAWAVGYNSRLVGVMANASDAGIASAILVALSFAYAGWWVRIAALVPLLALVLADSRGSLLGLILGLLAILVMVPAFRRDLANRVWVLAIVVGLPTLFWLRSRNAISALPARPDVETPGSSGSTGGIEGTLDTVSSGRLGIYREYLTAWLHKPWLGTGYRTPPIDVGGGLHIEAHNIYLSVLVWMGVLGAAVVLVLLVGLLRSAAWQSLLLAASVTVLAVNLTSSSLFGFGGPTAVMSWLVLFGWAATGLNRAGHSDPRGSTRVQI